MTEYNMIINRVWMRKRDPPGSRGGQGYFSFVSQIKGIPTPNPYPKSPGQKSTHCRLMNFSIFVTQKEEKMENQWLCPYSSSQTKVVYTQSGCPLGVHKMLWKKISKKFSFWRYAKKPDFFIQTLKIHKKFSWRSKLDFFSGCIHYV